MAGLLELIFVGEDSLNWSETVWMIASFVVPLAWRPMMMEYWRILPLRRENLRAGPKGGAAEMAVNPEAAMMRAHSAAPIMCICVEAEGAARTWRET